MHPRYSYLFVISAFFVLAFTLQQPLPASAAEVTEAQFKNMLADSLLKNPGMVMGVLENNSEAVLSIAQSEGEASPKNQGSGKETGQRNLVAQADGGFSETQFKAMLARVLEENPNLILDVLRSHPEEVFLIAQKGNEERKKSALLEQWKEDAKTPKIFTIENRLMRGAPNAPVLIATYSDFCCPHCARASTVIEEYMINNPSKARFIFKHRPLSSHKYSRIAAQYFIAASMQNDLKAWALYKGLYGGREQLIAEGEEFIIPLAEKIGLDMARLKADVGSAQVLRILDEDLNEAKKFGFDGAPYILLNNLVLAGAPNPSILELGVQEAMRLK